MYSCSSVPWECLLKVVFMSSFRWDLARVIHDVLKEEIISYKSILLARKHSLHSPCLSRVPSHDMRCARSAWNTGAPRTALLYGNFQSSVPSIRALQDLRRNAIKPMTTVEYQTSTYWTSAVQTTKKSNCGSNIVLVGCSYLTCKHMWWLRSKRVILAIWLLAFWMSVKNSELLQPGGIPELHKAASRGG